MKKTIFIMALLFQFNAYAETCAEKITSIETKIEYAKKHKNTNQLNGLETALSEAKANCSDEKLKSAKEQKIKDKEKDVEEAVAELNEAKDKNKSATKIKKKQDKLNEEMKELKNLRD